MFNETPFFEFRGPWGVPVQVGPSLFLLLLVFVSLSGSTADLVYQVFFFLILIGSVFLHEIGHAWGCLIQGVPVRRVMLYGGGGFCEPSRSTSAYEDELVVAMGPIVNLTLWAVASLAAPLAPGGDVAWALGTVAEINLYLAIFNLLPVMPLDGGRLFHLLLIRLIPPGAAIRVAGAVGLLFVLLWIPLMMISFVAMGFFLVFFPPVLLHWHMLTRRLA